MTSPKRREVIERLKSAFAGVRLEDGVGLKEGQGLDDYEDKWVCAQYREEDEKDDWEKIPVDKLTRCHSSLSFFDPKGMRFHLPAFLIAELEGTMNMGTEFHLVQLDDYARSKLVLLSAQQKAAIEACLWEMLDDISFAFEHENIARAIEEYWSNREGAEPDVTDNSGAAPRRA